MPKQSTKKSAPHKENKNYGAAPVKSASKGSHKGKVKSSSSSSVSKSTSKPSSSTKKPSSSHKKKSTKHAPLEQQLITSTGNANYAQIDQVIDQFRKKKGDAQEKKKSSASNDDDDIDVSSEEEDMIDESSQQQLISALDDDDDDDDEAEESYVSATMSKRILQVVHEQQKEEQHEDEDEPQQPSTASSRIKSRMISLRQNEDEDSEEELDEEVPEEEEEIEEIELSAEDEKSLSMFLPESTGVRRTLADIIMEKIREKEESKDTQQQQGQTEHIVKQRMDPKVVQVYTQVGKYLSHYSSGKIPKAFKIVPTLKNWEEVLYLTSPDSWTAQSMYVATRLFASNLNPKMAQRFYNLVLLPRIRRDMDEKKVLNYHLYQAVKKALYKPPAFFKGLLLPMVEEGCSVREGIIMSSILSKCSIPVLHAAVALLKLTQIPYSGPTILFIKTLLNKKYSLPYKVVDALVSYFCSFTTDSREMPVIWHQCLLVFIQRYRRELNPQQRNHIKALLRKQQHHTITAEIRHQLLSTTNTDVISGVKGNTRPINHSSNTSSTAPSPALSATSGGMEFD